MPYEKSVNWFLTRDDEDAAGQRNLGVVKVGHEATGMPVWKVIEAGQRKPEGYNRTQVRRGGQGYSESQPLQEERKPRREFSVGSNQNGSAYEKLARMDEELRVEANGLDDDGDDTDSDESRSVSS
ncbi:hypothetical protein J3E69DRAFT_366259 [Trichoderma sp. SZMC 28015]